MRFEPVKQICNGSPEALTQRQIPAVIAQANKQLGDRGACQARMNCVV
jgi:hypothetical protein